MRRIMALLFVVLVTPACDGDSPTAPGDVPISFETVVSSSVSGFSTAERTAVRDASDWARVWRILHAGQSPVPELPAIDFDREIALLAAAGNRPNGCYAIEFTEARLSDGLLVLIVTQTLPGPGCVCTQAITQPVHVVRIERLPAREVFVERQRQLAC